MEAIEDHLSRLLQEHRRPEVMGFDMGGPAAAMARWFLPCSCFLYYATSTINRPFGPLSPSTKVMLSCSNHATLFASWHSITSLKVVTPSKVVCALDQLRGFYSLSCVRSARHCLLLWQIFWLLYLESRASM
jgi:hypothetical protein